MKSSSSQPKDRLLAARVIPVLRFDSAELTRLAVDCLVEAGFGSVEITMTTPGAVGLVRDLCKSLGDRCLVGAGTVLDDRQARDCIDAGAQFLVSPAVVPGLAAQAHAAGRLALIGGFTPTEILAAAREGADIVKVFPASSGGPSHLGAIHAVYPDIRLCPTGGVSLDNMGAYFRAGASVVGVGNAIVPLADLKAGRREAVIAYAAAFLRA